MRSEHAQTKLIIQCLLIVSISINTTQIMFRRAVIMHITRRNEDRTTATRQRHTHTLALEQEQCSKSKSERRQHQHVRRSHSSSTVQRRIHTLIRTHNGIRNGEERILTISSGAFRDDCQHRRVTWSLDGYVDDNNNGGGGGSDGVRFSCTQLFFHTNFCSVPASNLNKYLTQKLHVNRFKAHAARLWVLLSAKR